MNMNKSAFDMRVLERALLRLEEIAKLPPTHEGRDDALIQRFEFVIELHWKTLKHLLEERGRILSLPKQIMQAAFEAGWLGHDDVIWVEMIKDRNLTSHTYNQELASKIAQKIIGDYLPLLKSNLTFLMENLCEKP